MPAMNDANQHATILLVEDEQEIRRLVRGALTHAGFKVVEAASLSQALLEAGTRKPELVVLDLGLPDGDGVDFIREVRAWSGIPIIVLSARGEEPDKVRALDAGADDYVSKPFGTAELLARVRSSLRRTRMDNDGVSVIVFGDIEVDLARRIIKRAGVEIHLTPIEYRLLTALISHPGKVLTHRHLLREVWGPGHVEHSHYLRIYMGNLRHKLEADPAQPIHLLTETGIGYRFVS
jgi:two-component system KDP operon response regulator KdpE